jgi:hypothetical protein
LWAGVYGSSTGERRRYKYAATAVAIIALFKYGMAAPFKRLERLQNYWMMPLPAATRWDLVSADAKLSIDDDMHKEVPELPEYAFHPNEEPVR